MTKAGLLTEHGTVLNRNITPSLRFWSNGSRKQDRKEKKQEKENGAKKQNKEKRGKREGERYWDQQAIESKRKRNKKQTQK